MVAGSNWSLIHLRKGTVIQKKIMLITENRSVPYIAFGIRLFLPLNQRVGESLFFFYFELNHIVFLDEKIDHGKVVSSYLESRKKCI